MADSSLHQGTVSTQEALETIATILENSNGNLSRSQIHEIAVFARSMAASHGGWRPISTAPKDESMILLTDCESIEPGGWVKNSSLLDITQADCDYDLGGPAPSGGMWSPNWLSPTHWMPLPSMPGKRKKKPSRAALSKSKEEANG